LPRVASAQSDLVAVPDLTGLSVPEAAALLNRTGLNLGAEKTVPWTESAGLPKDKIGAQAIQAGQQVSPGTAVEVTVLRVTNIILLYDYNMLTLVNKTGDKLNIGDVTLGAFKGTSWRLTQLDDGQCAQIWAIVQKKPVAVAECAAVQTWIFDTNKALHFWRSTPTSAQFAFTKAGSSYGLCNSAAPDSGTMRCDIYWPGGDEPDAMDYIYFAYTADQLVIRNNSKDEWLPLTGVNVINNLPAVKGYTFPVGDPSAYPSQPAVGSVARLAPNQCIWFTNGDPQITAPPQPCDVMAKLDVDPALIYWASDFGVDGVLDDKPHFCPKATPGKLTICVMPR
jgi:hypothetical protein